MASLTMLNPLTNFGNSPGVSRNFYVSVIFLLLLTISTIFATPMDKNLIDYPNVDQLFDRLAIRLDHGESHIYAYTDRSGGFWQGMTFSYNRQDGGYTVDSERLLADFLVMQGNAFLDRRQASRVEIMPHQISHFWSNGWRETITVLPEQKGFLCFWESSEAVPPYEKSGDRLWSVTPLFWALPEDMDIRTDDSGEVALFRNKTGSMTMALYGAGGKWHTPADLPKSLKYFTEKKAYPGHIGLPQGNSLVMVCLFGSDQAKLTQEVKIVASSASSIVARKKAQLYEFLLRSYSETNRPQYDKALAWAKLSGRELVVTQFGKGIWAGLPWFDQNWGRDTFISLPGISLVTGQFKDAKEIISHFTTYQQNDLQDRLYGRIPNRVNSPRDIIYNTADGTPWLVREILEYILYTGDKEFAKEMMPVIRASIQGARKNFLDSSAFLTHDDADTWMDARIEGKEAWSPRGNRAVEIQALWHNQLVAGATLARLTGNEKEAREWETLADKVKANFRACFYDERRKTLFDHLDADGMPDRQVRPNQIFAVTVPLLVPLLPQDIENSVVRNVVAELTYPHGVASLSQNDPYFHPFHRDQIYHFDAAYHNGLCWQWLAGPVVTGMVRYGYEDEAFVLSQNLADQILNTDMPGSLSELVEPIPLQNGKIKWSGTYAQAWSVAEFVRNFYQDYLGIQPDMLRRKIVVAPRLPKEMSECRFVWNVGAGERIEAEFIRNRSFAFYGSSLSEPVKICLQFVQNQGVVQEAVFTLSPGEKTSLSLESSVLKKDTIALPLGVVRVLPSSDAHIHFQTPKLDPHLQSIRVPDFLEKIRLQK